VRDHDRILLHVDSWEDLLKLPDPLAEEPSFATAENPLRMYLSVAALRRALKDSLSCIAQNRSTCDTTPELKAETDALVAQRKAALAWLRQQIKPHVYVSLHPQTEWTVTSVDGADDVEDGDDKP
jgi:hypothetical protein